MSQAAAIGGFAQLLLTLMGPGDPPPPRAPQHLVYRAMAILVAALCLLGGICCAMASLWLFALPWLGRVGAPLLVAGVLLVAALALLLSARGRRKRLRPAPVPAGSAALLLAELGRAASAGETPILLTALFAGMALGTRSK